MTVNGMLRDAHLGADRIGAGAEQLGRRRSARARSPWSPLSTSLVLMLRPRAMGQMRMSKNSGMTPPTSLFQFALVAQELHRLLGPRRDAPHLRTARAMAARSSSVMVGSEPKPPCAPPECVEPERNDEQVRAHVVERLGELDLGAFTDGDHGDDGGDADDDAERRQQRPAFVARQRQRGRTDGLPEAHGQPHLTQKRGVAATSRRATM